MKLKLSPLHSAGFIYSLITMPFETAKNRMAFQKKDAAVRREAMRVCGR